MTADISSSKKIETRGRKKKEGVRRLYRLSLLLWEGEDDDLITFLDGLPDGKRAAGIKFALRSGGALADLQPTDEDDDDEDLDFDMDEFLS